MPNGYGRTGFMPRMQGGGVYNPYMKHPDIAGGINMLTEIVARQQAQERATQQQEWERGITEQQLEIQRRREERLAEPRQATQWDFKQNYAGYMVETEQWNPQEAANYLATNKVPEKSMVLPPEIQSEIMTFKKIKDWNKVEPKVQIELFQDHLIRKRPSKIVAPQIPATVKELTARIGEGIKRYQSDIDRLEKPPTGGEVAMAALTGAGVMQQKSEARESLMAAQSELIRIQTQMSETNTMPSPEDIELSRTLLQFTGRAEKEKEFWKTEKATKKEIDTLAVEIFNAQKKKGDPISMPTAREWALELWNERQEPITHPGLKR